MSTHRRHLVFDCDPGCDDAVAIAYVLEKGSYHTVDFLTVAGNVPVEQTTENTRRILAACRTESATNSEGPICNIYRGCARSMMADEPSAASVHGRDGLGDAPNSLIAGLCTAPPISPLSAVEFLLSLARDGTAERFDLLCTGPLTNLATALSLMTAEQRHHFFGRCDRFVVMGGVFNSLGNISHSAEFNTFVDPAATQVVLSILRQLQNAGRVGSHLPPHRISLCFVSLDATEMVGIPLAPQMYDKKGGNSPTAKVRFLRYVLNQYGQFHVYSSARRPTHAGIPDFDKEAYVKSTLAGSSGATKLEPFCYLHDALAAWVIVNDGMNIEGVWQDADIRIDTNRGESRGRVIICHRSKDRSDAPNMVPSVGTAVRWLNLDGPRGSGVKAVFLEDIRSLLQIAPMKQEQKCTAGVDKNSAPSPTRQSND